MEDRNVRTVQETAPMQEASPVTLDPVLQVWVRVVKQALEDLQSSDPVMSLDALTWLLFSEEVSAIFELLNLDDQQILVSIVRVSDAQS